MSGISSASFSQWMSGISDLWMSGISFFVISEWMSVISDSGIPAFRHFNQFAATPAEQRHFLLNICNIKPPGCRKSALRYDYIQHDNSQSCLQ